jgi:thioredoxin-like negative regulator of GroEL
MRDRVLLNGLVRRPLIALLGLAVLLVTVGCAEPGKNFTRIHGWPEFQTRVLQSDRPVLIEFNKDPCPTCVLMLGELDKLYPQYSDRVLFASMTIMKDFFAPCEPEVIDRYKVTLVPTTILFNKGQEVCRWNWNLHGADEIGEALKKLVGPPRKPDAVKPAAPATPAPIPAPK